MSHRGRHPQGVPAPTSTPPHPAPAARTSPEERDGVPDTDATARTPLGVGESLNERAEDLARGAEETRWAKGRHRPALRPGHHPRLGLRPRDRGSGRLTAHGGGDRRLPEADAAVVARHPLCTSTRSPAASRPVRTRSSSDEVLEHPAGQRAPCPGRAPGRRGRRPRPARRRARGGTAPRSPARSTPARRSATTAATDRSDARISPSRPRRPGSRRARRGSTSCSSSIAAWPS